MYDLTNLDEVEFESFFQVLALPNPTERRILLMNDIDLNIRQANNSTISS